MTAADIIPFPVATADELAPVDLPRMGDWAQRAACAGADPDLFFPGRGEDVESARQVCARCPVQVECLQYALDNGERFGVWGGKSERERRRMRRTRPKGSAR